jgi:hypothetical protein
VAIAAGALRLTEQHAPLRSSVLHTSGDYLSAAELPSLSGTPWTAICWINGKAHVARGVSYASADPGDWTTFTFRHVDSASETLPGGSDEGFLLDIGFG